MANRKKILPEHIDIICEMIVEGKSITEIAKRLNVNRMTIIEVSAKPDYSARVREARINAADKFAEMAEEVLSKLKPKSTMIEMQKARELASHYRWKASKLAPKRYGDKIEQEITGSLKLDVSETKFAIKTKGK